MEDEIENDYIHFHTVLSSKEAVINKGSMTCSALMAMQTLTHLRRGRFGGASPGSTFAQESERDACFVKYVLSGRRRAVPLRLVLVPKTLCDGWIGSRW